MQDPIPTPGSLVSVRSRLWRVESAQRDRSVLRFIVIDRGRRVTFLSPFDRPSVVPPVARLKRSRLHQAAARLAGLVARAYTARGLPAALDVRMEVLPYQLEPALAVIAGVRRVLLADEVGLGKTIQAALALAEMERQRPAFRGLVIVPRSLRDQWREELRDRFGLSVTIMDHEGLLGVARAVGRGRNPWASAGLSIVSADFLKQPHVLDAIPPIPWDIVVIDEAHDSCGDSARHAATDEMARRARHVLLLTATPHVGDSVRFRRLENLGRLEGVSDPLVTFRRTRVGLGQLSRRHVRWSYVRPTLAESAVLDVVYGFEKLMLANVSERQREGALLLLSIFRKRALSTMTSLLISVERRLSWVSSHAPEVVEWLQPRLGFEDNDARADDDCAGLTAESGLSHRVERAWLRRLQGLTSVAVRHESKVRRVVNLLSRTREPVLVFTEFRHSLDAIKASIEHMRQGQRRLAVLHGGLSAAEQSAAVEAFRRGDVSVLLATDVASQGLNLQSQARWVISLELPWTPTRIEQRLGRVDRIGQTRVVHASLLVARHPAEHGLLVRLARRMLAVKHVVGGDALAGLTPPSELSVAHELLTGHPASDVKRADVTPVLLTSCRWRLPARAVAKQLLLKRSLTRRWQTRECSRRPHFTVLRRHGGHACARVIVVSVPIVDGAGRLVEHRLLSLALPGVDLAHVTSLVNSGAFQAWIAGRLQPRLLALRRRAMLASAARTTVEDAIARHLISIGWRVELQAGLFDRRDERMFTTARNEAREIERRALDEKRSRQRSSDLDIATPSLELAFCW